MPRVFRLDDVLAGPGVFWSEGGETLVEVLADRASARRLWAFVLSMALTDRATSVHFHPWLGEERLSYIQNDGLRYVVYPPPVAVASHFLAEARVLLGAGRVRDWLAWRTVAGTFEVEVNGCRSRWAGAVWGAGRMQGVEFYRDRQSSMHSFMEDAAEPQCASDARREIG